MMPNLTKANRRVIVGHQYKVIRRFLTELRKLRTYTRAQFDEAWARVVPDVPSPFDSMLNEGLMRGAGRGEDGFLWTLNARATAIVDKPPRLLTPLGLRSVREEVMSRVHAAVNDPDLSMEVGQLLLFGSALEDGLSEYGDLDIAVRPVTKAAFASRLDMVMQHGDDEQARTALLSYLKSGNAFIQIVEPWYLYNLGCDYKVIYEVPDFEARVRKDESNAISEATREHLKFSR